MSKKEHTVASAFNYYLTEVKVSRSTKANFGYLRDKLGPAGMLTVPLESLTPAKVLKFLNGLKLSESTVFLNYVQFKTVINRYLRDHALPFTVRLERLMKAPKQKKIVEGEENYLTLQEVKELMAVDLSDNEPIKYARDLFCLMSFTGLSVSDLMKFDKNWISANGKWLTYYRKKTGNRCEIPMLPVTHQLIKDIDWTRQISKRTLQYNCDSLSKLVGRKVTPHTARHTWGSVALELGFSLESVSAMLGHSSILITQRVYAKVSRQKIEREMKEIPKAIREEMKID